MKTKRIIACIISCILFMVCIPFTAAAEENEKTIVYRTSGNAKTSSNCDVYWTLIANDDMSFYVDVISGSNDYTKMNNVGKIAYDDNIVSCYDTWCCNYASVFTTYADTYEELNVVYKESANYYFGKSFTKLYFTVKELDSENSCTIKIFGVEVTIDFSKSSIKPSYAEIIYNNGSSAMRIKTDTDVSDIQEYIDKLEAENKNLKEQLANTEEIANEYANRLNALTTNSGTNDINKDGVFSIDDVQYLLMYYTESVVAKSTTDTIDVWYVNRFGGELR